MARTPSASLDTSAVLGNAHSGTTLQVLRREYLRIEVTPVRTSEGTSGETTGGTCARSDGVQRTKGAQRWVSRISPAPTC